MIKHVFVFQPAVNLIEADRYYFRFHSKEVVRFLGPWLRRYETYRALDAPSDADRFGVLRGRLTELWYNSVDKWKQALPLAAALHTAARRVGIVLRPQKCHNDGASDAHRRLPS